MRFHDHLKIVVFVCYIVYNYKTDHGKQKLHSPSRLPLSGSKHKLVQE